MLSLLGLGSAGETVYRAILENPSHGVNQLSEELGWPVRRVRDALDELARLSLLRPSWEDPRVFRLVRPEVGLSALLAREETALLHRQQEIERSRAIIAQMIATYADLNPAQPGEGAETLLGIDTVRTRIEELALRCRNELRVFDPQGAQTLANIDASRPLDRTLLENGVEIRIVYLASARNDQSIATYATWLTELGGQVRATPTLPTRMIIFDWEAALLPIDPGDSSVGAVLLHGAGIVTALTALFEQTWERADAFGEEPRRDERGLSGQEREVLRLLSTGHTDEAVARKLDISVRTLRRITAELMERLDARSRFQAGYLAADRGWIPARR
ncbi:helix-turn-helix transcriptional regulator [Streptosporangium lutulentum]|uniref:DNA-binding CsgD family transcriptional regulator/sugar-specific transcriptional regulator TrmB n=1 Tax=Streptosporangium lutulentum TaxID=1461250 RepID=A0ABT9QTC5_9ACTN|nr:helix-turn-helix transcriptional regulator [Streptosporangium lutulentum]MDP9850000.1 DNA-binding CsgD family transcriptional regulator/sugar-specific transcriptional regulator TrmB [Streptosporangium lutulentum]